jgi:hypothetical protein
MSRSIEFRNTPNAGNATAFVNQGQVDWVAFGNTIYSASLAIMQRLAGAGVQPITHSGGLALASQFQLGQVGQRRIEAALTKLAGHGLFNNILHVGFGVHSFVNTVAETQAGINLVALCACLTDSHSEPMAARILAALWDVEGFPLAYKPSPTQFLRLIQTCAGVALVTTFGDIVDVMLGGRGSGHRHIVKHQEGPLMASEAHDIAKALHGLFKISKSEVEQINIIGGAECGFMAALAAWLFNVRVEVQDAAGHLIFTNLQGEDDAQVLIQYMDADDDFKLQLVTATYILRPHEELFRDSSESRMVHLIIRTPWDGCLKRVFGSTFQKYLKVSRQFGVFLGSAARIYAAIACGEASVGKFSRKEFFHFAPTAYGVGYIETVTRVFPELTRTTELVDTMMDCQLYAFEKAFDSLETCVHSMKNLCDCSICRAVTRPSSSHSRQCLVVMLMTIRHVALVMASVINDSNIQPTVAGLEEISSLQGYFWFEAIKAAEHDTRFLVPAVVGLKIDTDETFLEADLGLDSGRGFAAPSMLTAEIETLIFGRRPGDEEIEKTSNRTAFSRSGICVYIQALRGLTTRPESISLIHILPGHIQRGDSRYDRILDGVQSQTSFSSSQQESLELVKYDLLDRRHPTLVVSLADTDVQMKALVAEPFEGKDIMLFYRASVPSGSIDIQPGVFTEKILTSSGLLYCDGPHELPQEAHLHCAAVTSGWRLRHAEVDQLPEDFGISCCVWNLDENEQARCFVFAYQSRQEYPNSDRAPLDHSPYPQPNTLRRLFEPNMYCSVFLRRNECLACCTKVLQLINANVIGFRARDRAVAHIVY